MVYGNVGVVAKWVGVVGEVIPTVGDIVVLSFKVSAWLFGNGAVVVALLVGVVIKSVVLSCVEGVIDDTGGGRVIGLVVGVVAFKPC